MVGVLSIKKFAILKGLRVHMDGDLSTIQWKFKALMVCGGDDLNGVDQWTTKDDLIRKLKVQNLTSCIHNSRSHLKRQCDGTF